MIIFVIWGKKIKWHQCVMWSCVVSWILMSRRRDTRRQKNTGKVKENIAVIVLKFRKPIPKNKLVIRALDQTTSSDSLAGVCSLFRPFNGAISV